MNKPLLDNYGNLQQKAKCFIQQAAVKYFAVNPNDLPDEGGVYILSLKEDNGTEACVAVNFTENLRGEILAKREAFIATYRGNNLKIEKGKSPRFITQSESLSYLQQNCLLRFVVETDLKEQLALTAIVAAIIKPWSNGN